jgi:peroxiredoxin
VQTDTALTRHFGQVSGVRTFHYQLDSAIAAIDSTESVRLGEKLPDPRIPNAWGEMISLLRFHGNPLLVFVWQSGNRDSEEAVASVKTIYESYRGQGLELYMISVDSIAAQWEKSVNHYRLPCTQVCDFKGVASPIWKRYGIQSVPSCFLLDRKGVIVSKNEWGDQLNSAVSKQFAQ